MNCATCGKEVKIGVYVLEWDEDGPFVMSGQTIVDSINPPPNPRDIYCSNECVDKVSGETQCQMK
jgi:hypothetical protein